MNYFKIHHQRLPCNVLPCIENGYKVHFAGIDVNCSILSSSTRGNLKALASSPAERVQESTASAEGGQRSSWGTGQGSFSWDAQGCCQRLWLSGRQPGSKGSYRWSPDPDALCGSVYAKWRGKLIAFLKAQELGVLVRSPSRGEGVSLEYPRVWKTSQGASQKSSLSPPDTTRKIRAKFHRATAWMRRAWGTAGPCSEVSSTREKTEGGAKERTCVGGRDSSISGVLWPASLAFSTRSRPTEK